MTPSIIRRFARYQGIFFTNSVDDIGHLARKLYAPHGRVGEDQTRDKIVQSLTRIEDAESLTANANAVTSVSDGVAFLRVRETLDSLANALLVKSGIDPDKWREVKDE